MLTTKQATSTKLATTVGYFYVLLTLQTFIWLDHLLMFYSTTTSMFLFLFFQQSIAMVPEDESVILSSFYNTMVSLSVKQGQCLCLSSVSAWNTAVSVCHLCLFRTLLSLCETRSVSGSVICVCLEHCCLCLSNNIDFSYLCLFRTLLSLCLSSVSV